MNNKFKNIKKLLHLSTKEKANLWEKIESNIFSYEKNVRLSELSSLRVWEWKKSSQTLYLNKRNMIATIITTILIALSGWASFAAEASLPWDLLYPIKVHINEVVQSAFTLWAENEASLQLHLIEERVKEKVELEAKWKLTADVDSEIKARIEKHSEKFEKEKKSVEDDWDDEIVSKLELRFSKLIDNFWIQTAIQAWGNVNLGTWSTEQEMETDDKNENESSSWEIDDEDDSIGFKWKINVGIWNDDKSDDSESTENNDKWENSDVKVKSSIKSELENNDSGTKMKVEVELWGSLYNDKWEEEDDDSISSELKSKWWIGIK